MIKLSLNFLFILITCLQVKAVPVTEEQKKGREAVIADCEARVRQVEADLKRIQPLKEPGFFSTSATKEKYERNKLGLSIIKKELLILMNHVNQKIQLRQITSAEKLGAEANAYGDYCRQSTDALGGFGRFLEDGTSGDARKNKIYGEWLNVEKCGKYVCP